MDAPAPQAATGMRSHYMSPTVSTRGIVRAFSKMTFDVARYILHVVTLLLMPGRKKMEIKITDVEKGDPIYVDVKTLEGGNFIDPITGRTQEDGLYFISFTATPYMSLRRRSWKR